MTECSPVGDATSPTGTSPARRMRTLCAPTAPMPKSANPAGRGARTPGVIAVFTGDDLDLKSLPAALPAKGRGGMELINPGRPALAKGRVRFGDAVALVVAESAAAAQDAAELVGVEYRDLPPSLTPPRRSRRARRSSTTRSRQHRARLRVGRRANEKEAFAKAAHVVQLDVDISRVIGNPMEPRACLAARLGPVPSLHVHAKARGSCATSSPRCSACRPEGSA